MISNSFDLLIANGVRPLDRSLIVLIVGGDAGVPIVYLIGAKY